jgi:hypothetical protein
VQLTELDSTVRETTSKLEQETGLRISLGAKVEQLNEEGAAVKEVLATTTLKYEQVAATHLVRGLRGCSLQRCGNCESDDYGLANGP